MIFLLAPVIFLYWLIMSTPLALLLYSGRDTVLLLFFGKLYHLFQWLRYPVFLGKIDIFFHFQSSMRYGVFDLPWAMFSYHWKSPSFYGGGISSCLEVSFFLEKRFRHLLLHEVF